MSTLSGRSRAANNRIPLASIIPTRRETVSTTEREVDLVTKSDSDLPMVHLPCTVLECCLWVNCACVQRVDECVGWTSTVRE